MKLHRYVTAAAGVAFAASSAFAQSKPTVAVLYFRDGAIGKANEELAPLSKGIADVLITEMADNPAIKVVERDALQNILAEQKLATDGTADKETAVKVGKLLSAHHMLSGGFITDPAGTMILNVHSTNVETGVVEYTASVTDKTANLLSMIHKLAVKINTGLKLPDIPRQVGEVRQAKDEKIPFQSVMLYSRGLEAKDKGDKSGAVTLFKQALSSFPGYDAPQRELDKLK